MKSINVFLFPFMLACALQAQAKSRQVCTSSKLYFTENKGQVKDQDGCARNDIQFALKAPGINIFIGDAQMHYQFSKKDRDNCAGSLGRFSFANDGGLLNKTENIISRPAFIETYRMDVELVGANRNAPAIATEEQAYYENYYLPGCPANGIQVHAYKKLICKNVYPGIDWVVCIKGDKLEQEFIVGAGADASLIKLKYSGQTALSINEDGSITAATPMGIIKEKPPVCYVQNGSQANVAGRPAFKLTGNVLSFEISKPGSAFVIDPEVEWATYYGPDSNTSPVYSAVCDNSANIYFCGLTYADVDGNIATTGSYQDTYAGDADGYLAKFDSSGNRLWGTYYGGSGGDWGVGVACDNLGNIYLGGTTGSTAGIATAGCQQPAYGGGLWDGFLVKFDSSGIRQWATYIGGSGAEIPTSVSCDLLGHVYIAGFTSSSNNIGTPGGFHPVRAGGYEDFLVQYDSLGVRQWGTYYGGSGDEYSGAVCTDGYNVYLAGYTSSDTGIASALGYQTVLNGGQDAFLAKFTSEGIRDWGTYYGGEGPETIGGVSCDRYGSIYLLGSTGSATGISSPGCFQPANGGGTDVFLAKFEPELGHRAWGTYYGGPGTENADLSKMATDSFGYVYITGYTNSVTGIASPTGAVQPAYGGGDQDAFFAKFNNAGVMQWATYYGGTGEDQGRACAFDGRNIYLSGETNSTNNIATPGSFLPAGGGASAYYQGFLAKFTDDSLFALSSPVPAAGAMETMTIFPSPNNGSFTLSGTVANNTGIAKIIITAVDGRGEIREDAIISNGSINKHISLRNGLPAGEYLLKVISSGKAQVLKFVKE